MDKAEKMDCGANGEVILCAKSPLLPQSSNLCDPITQKTGLKGARKEVCYPTIHDENSELS
jgi:hypothetical protein